MSNQKNIDSGFKSTRMTLEMEHNISVKKYVFRDIDPDKITSSIVNLSKERDTYHLVIMCTHDDSGIQKQCFLANGKANTYYQALENLYDQYKRSPVGA